MQVFPVKTPLIMPKEDLIEMILKAMKKQRLELMDNDVLAISSKIVSITEGRIAKLSEIKPSKKAKNLAKQYSLDPAFVELVLQEADHIVGGVEKAVLTLNDDVFTVNAGIDNKNAPEGYAVLWPKNPQQSAERIQKEVANCMGRRVGVLIVDSTVAPLRWGTRGLAIGVAGFKPIKDYRKTRDLFGREVLITLQAVADDLASVAHVVMGEAAERTPVAIIREAPVTFVKKVDASTMKIAFKDCVYMGSFKPKHAIR